MKTSLTGNELFRETLVKINTCNRLVTQLTNKSVELNQWFKDNQEAINELDSEQLNLLTEQLLKTRIMMAGR